MARRSLVFFGAGPVALEALAHLHARYDIELVVTKPNPRSSRAKTPVFDYAQSHQLPTIQPSSKMELEQMLASQPLRSRAGVVVDYGVIITKNVIDSFELGILNSHYSLLPQWRGADPITFSLLSGQPTTGVSLMIIDEKLDEGMLIAQEPYDIAEDETIDSLTSNLIDLSNRMFNMYLDDYLDGSIEPYQQPQDVEPTYSRKLTKSDGSIDWTKPADQLEREVRAYLGWPGSKTTLEDTEVAITEAYAVPASPPDSSPGDIIAHPKASAIEVVCGTGSLWITRLKPAGKQAMDARSFSNGYLNR